MARPAKDNTLEAELWAAATKLRGSMDASKYKNVVLGLVFLKYVSDAFEARAEQIGQLTRDPDQADYYTDDDTIRASFVEDPDEYRSVNVFWVPEEAREIEVLRRSVAAAGMTVVEATEGLHLAPAANIDPLPRTVQVQDDRIVVHGPNAVETDVLHSVIAGRLDPQRLDRPSRRALATLVRAGLVEEHDGEHVASASVLRTLSLN